MILDDGEWPTFGWATDMRPALRTAREAKRPIVLGTLVDVDGPSPRAVGSQMVFDETKVAGYFSGGCVEADVANHAARVVRDGKPRMLIYGRGSPWMDIRLQCGGRLEILLERIDCDDPAVGLLLDLQCRRRRALWTSDGLTRNVVSARSGIISLPQDRGNYGLCYDPDWQVAVVGGDPVSLALIDLAARSGFAATLIRPAGPAARPPVLSGTYSRDSISIALGHLKPDRWTAVVTATHDDDVDDDVILSALRYSPRYIGVLGAAHRIPARRERLLEAGLAPERIAAIRAPIGLPGCGKGPWEIAVSVIAEIMQLRAAAQPLGVVTAFA